ncbi:MAG: radical SAM protein [Candidatus Schekmanbacteria bacterium]|nr:MAG: radical SAM protein [Candidatus Schekmanbacteria bacterium]
MLVKEIFSSIQGESSYSGIPCFFIRTSGCNLRCRWCDTVYAYEGGKEYSVDDLETYVRESAFPLVSLTGGEPLLQEDSISFLTRIASMRDKIVLLETNGSISLKDVDERVIKVVDVKCPSSGEAKSFLNENLSYLGKKDELKFVIADREDYEWATNFIEKNKASNLCKILYSPIIDKMDMSKLVQWILDDKLNVRFQIQLHKIIWKKGKRGV